MRTHVVLSLCAMGLAAAAVDAQAAGNPRLCGTPGRLAGPRVTAVYDLPSAPGEHKVVKVKADRWSVVVWQTSCTVGQRMARAFLRSWPKGPTYGILPGVASGWTCTVSKPFGKGTCANGTGTVTYLMTGAYTLAQIRQGKLGPVMAAYAKASK